MLNQELYHKFHAWLRLFTDHPEKDYIKRRISDNICTYRVFLPIIDKEFVETDSSFVVAFSRLVEKCCIEIDEFVLENDKYKQILFDEISEINEISKRIGERISDKIRQIENPNEGALEHCLDTNPLHEENYTVDSLNSIIESEDCSLFLEIADKEEFSKDAEGDSLAIIAKQKLFARVIVHNCMFVYLNCIVRNNAVISIGAVSRPILSVARERKKVDSNDYYN